MPRSAGAARKWQPEKAETIAISHSANVRLATRNHFLPMLSVQPDGNLVSHRPRRNKIAASRPNTAAAFSCNQLMVGSSP